MSGSFHPELQYQIALTLAPAIGPVTARKLIKEAGSAREVFRMSRTTLEKIPGIGPLMSESIHSSSLLGKAEKEMAFMEKNQVSALYLEDAEYPQRLKECEDAPILLYCQGSDGLRHGRALSVVGTRRASFYGKEMCRSIVLDLSSRIKDLVIISGLAFGIDVIAHRAALEGGIPTVAVLGHGFHTLYPNAHRETSKKIRSQGALVTDFPSGMGPERNNFLRRNRIIAGMASATLVVESAASGGALITAAMASSYQRDVLAVPGRATDDRSKGCNRLIKENLAGMVESAEDVIGHLNWPEDGNQHAGTPSGKISFTEQELRLLELLTHHGTLRVEELSSLSELPIQVVLSRLTEMELKRWVFAEPGKLYQSMISLP
ncbi:MAG: DNA-processing protein DprA [Bacteroidales bacterium]|nr:DNA-processing protein DprA [Bacteroidales bacterium]